MKRCLLLMLIVVAFCAVVGQGLVSSVSIAGTVALPQTGQKSCFDEKGNIISCANTRQDGDIQAGVVWPSPRFTDNGDGTLTDNLTGLMWLKDAGCLGDKQWLTSFANVDDLNKDQGNFGCEDYIANFTDWRLPNVNELESLVNTKVSDVPNTYLIGEGFTNVQSDSYWTSTSLPFDNPGSAYQLSMWDGGMSSSDKNSRRLTWSVRSVQDNPLNDVDILSTPAEVWQTGQRGSFASGDDGDTGAGVELPEPRFSLNGDGTVIDNLTGLMWLADADCFGGDNTWRNSFNIIDDFNNSPDNFGCEDYTTNFSDWRLPNRKELYSLIDHSTADPTLTRGNPFRNVSGISSYWSSTTWVRDTSEAWVVSLQLGWVKSSERENREANRNGGHVWPVRLGLETFNEPVTTPTPRLAPEPTQIPNQTPTPTPTPTPTITPQPTAEIALTPSPTPTQTPTQIPTPTPTGPPTADFKADPIIGFAPLQVQFTDQSVGIPSSWIWDFGDERKSSQQNPIHIYQDAGIYTVLLTSANSFGKDSIEKADLIEVDEGFGLDADFTVDKSTGFAPLEIKFIDTSEGDPTNWIWEFGDGGTGDKQNPIHVYPLEGLYSVSLTISRPGGETDVEIKTNLINVIENTPVADFLASVTAGQAPLKVSFTDLSQPVDSIANWIWDFSDGATDTNQNPEHQYNIEGFYTVSLTISNSAGADSEIKTNLITVKGQNVPVGDFIANQTVGLAPFTVQFFDQSEPLDNIANWIWDFGDGIKSEEQHPTHVYQQEGIFSVILTVSNSFGADSEVKNNIIAVTGTSDDVLAGFSASNNVGVAPFNVQFSNNSGGDVTESTWNFGDGITSIEKSPNHLYNQIGEFDVSLAVNGKSSADNLKRERFIKIINKEDVASWFAASPLIGNGPLEVQFVDRTVGETANWAWDFGDEETSTEQNPKHLYTEKGKYTVTLLVSSKSSTSDVKKRSDFIEVLDMVDISQTPIPDQTPAPVEGSAPTADFIADKTSGTVPLNVQFTDVSTGDPTTWRWSFGDGSESIDQNSSHEYTKTGFFSVTLTVSNDLDEDSLTKENFIEVLEENSSGKSFTFKCRQHSLIAGNKGIFEKMIMELGSNEQCAVTLTNLEPGVPVEVSTYLRSGRSTSIQVSPENGTTDSNGQMEFTISAIEKGTDWIAWAVKNDKGQFEFSKSAYDNGTAWGMFVEVK